MEVPESGQAAKGIGGVGEALAHLLTLKPELVGRSLVLCRPATSYSFAVNGPRRGPALMAQA